MPINRTKKTFTITNIPGCGPSEVVFARQKFTVGDQEEINNQLIAMSVANGGVDMQTNFGAIKRATLNQMIESWTLLEEIELPSGETRLTPLPQINEDADVVRELDTEVADYLFTAIQMKRDPGLKPEAQEAFLTSAVVPTSAS